MYEEGEGVEKNIKLAREWYRKASVKGEESQSALKRLEQLLH